MNRFLKGVIKLPGVNLLTHEHPGNNRTTETDS